MSRCLLAILVANVLFALGAPGQEASHFRARPVDDRCPVEGTPLDLVIEALDARGEVLADFDWRRLDARFEGLRDLQDRPIATLEEIAERTGLQNSAVRLKEGRLLLDRVLLDGDLVLVRAEERVVLIEGPAFGFAAILPPLVAILLAILCRQVVLALFLGVLSGVWVIAGGLWPGFVHAVTDTIPEALDADHVRIVIFSCLLGSLVAMVARMGGTQAMVAAMTRFGRSRRGAQFTTWLTGVLIFFDDYANALLVGNTMRPVTDRYRISREKLSYLVDATSAPVACIFVISTWIATEISYIASELGNPEVQAATGLSAEAGYQVFLATIPYNFYPILTLIFGLGLIWMGRDFGPMLRAERRAEKEGKLLRDGATPLSSREMEELEPVDPTRMRIVNAVLPIGTVILAVILGLWFTGAASMAESAAELRGQLDRGLVAVAERPAAEARLATLESPALKDVFGAANSYTALMIAAFLGVIVTVVLAVGQRLMRIGEAMDTVTAGIKAMVPAALVLILAWSLQSVCDRLGTSSFLIHHVSFTATLLPLAIFLLAAVVGFSTGTSWGTMGILVPLTIDYAVGLGMEASMAQAEVRRLLVSSVGAVLAGAVFGDHCSPISDTTIMSSMASGADHVDHVRTQMPYALTVAALASLVGYLPAGFGLSPWLSLALGAAICLLLIRFVGRPVTG
ncbi:MAG: Na+/H+ antiporter NhaC family protein [Planctomycetes bacterium]|nr:Na+/H+ antiporter NhaC family protein [Planctomycetota bacterium]